MVLLMCEMALMLERSLIASLMEVLSTSSFTVLGNEENCPSR